MTLLDRYIAKRFLATMFKVMASLVLLFLIIDLLTHRQSDIVKFQIPPRMVSLYYLTFVPTILFQYHAAALSVLIAGLMVLGRAAQDQEITAALAGGVSLRRIVRAPVCIALLVSIASLAIGETLAVRATRAASSIEDRYFSRFASSNRAGVSWANLQGGWTCHVLKFNRTARTGEDVYLHSIRDDLIQELRARRIYWDESQEQWFLEDGLWCTIYPQDGGAQKVDAIKQIPAPFQESPGDLFALDEPADTKSAAALAADLRRAESLGMPVTRHWVDYHIKLARPALPFIMIWLAIPFAVRLRHGGIAMGFGVSIAIAIAYLMLFFVGAGLGHLGKLPPPVAAWLANAVFLVAGAGLYAKTPS